MTHRLLPVLGFVLCWHAISILALQSGPLDECTKRTASLKVGMTRADVMKIMIRDGGIMGIYKDERLVLANNGKPVLYVEANQKLPVSCKVKIDFRPQGIPDTAYNNSGLFNRWMSDHGISGFGIPSDSIVKVSKPFLEPIFGD